MDNSAVRGIQKLSYNPQLFEAAAMKDNCHFHYNYLGTPDIMCSSSTL